MTLGTIPQRQVDPTVMVEGEALILLKGPSGQDGDVPVVDNAGNITFQTLSFLSVGDQLDLLKGPAALDGAVPTIDALGDITWDPTFAHLDDIGTNIP